MRERLHCRKLSRQQARYVRKAFRLRDQLTNKALASRMGCSVTTLLREVRESR